MRGEQFIPSRVVTQKILIYKRHVPNWISTTMEYIGCSEAIKCFKSEDAASKIRDIYIDLDQLLIGDTRQGKDFIKLLDREIKNKTPASTSLIVYIKEKSSKTIAYRFYNFLKNCGNSLPEPIPHNQISRIKDNDKVKKHTIIVISSFTSSGNKLNSISRELRSFVNSSLHYFCIIAKLPTLIQQNVLRSNLKYRSDKEENSNEFHVFISCHMGDYHDQRQTEYKRPSWKSEMQFWEKVDQTELPPLFKERVNSLKSEKGLINNLFLKNPFNHQDLSLRSNFALHDYKEDQDIPSQADIFFIVSGCFHYLRNPESTAVSMRHKDDKFLVQHEHVKSILDPQCFTRFNDGVIQASILRIARPSELNYSELEDSLEMSRVIMDIFKSKEDSNSNEAILEFLYAIAIQKLRLSKQHTANIVNHFDKMFKGTIEIDFFVNYIRTTMII